MKKGRSIVPHGHDNMCTGFIVLRGDFAGKHYDRVEDNEDHYLIKPTIDRTFKPGECSTISRPQGQRPLVQGGVGDGLHLQHPRHGLQPGEQEVRESRLRRSAKARRSAGGLIVAKKMTSAECHKKYG